MLWVSILFSVLSLAIYVSNPAGGEEASRSRKEYQRRARQALVAGKYASGAPYSVEATIIYAIGKFIQKEETNNEVWVIVGTATRLAMKMGYHREPSHSKALTPFEGEMRRRTFAMINTFDILFSFQAGVPPIVNDDDCDIRAPSNLFDEDFDEDSESLPPSRPYTDVTPMLQMAWKSKFIGLLKRVLRHSIAVKSTHYEDTLHLDQELRTAHADMPPALRMKPMRLSIADSPERIITRHNLEFTFLKSVIVLHRGYLTHDRSNPRYEYSRKACIDAAVRVLDLQFELDRAVKPGGLFADSAWFISDLTLHDFLLAAMVVSLDVYETHNGCTSNPMTEEEIIAQTTKYEALEKSLSFWVSRSATSKDARRACNILKAMLSKVPRPCQGGGALLAEGSPVPVLSGDQTNTPASAGSQVMDEAMPVDQVVSIEENINEAWSMMFRDPNQIDWVSLIALDTCVTLILPPVQS